MQKKVNHLLTVMNLKEDKMKIKTSSLCLCGCGELTTPGRKYISGHNQRGKKHSKESIEKQKLTVIEKRKENLYSLIPELCNCGCGEIVRPHSKYIHGHNNRGRTTSLKGKTVEEMGHKPNCQCIACRSKRGEYIHKVNCQCICCKQKRGEKLDYEKLYGKERSQYRETHECGNGHQVDCTCTICKRLKSNKPNALFKDRNWLAEQYYGNELTLKEMANLTNVDVLTILWWMNKYDYTRVEGASRESTRKKMSMAKIDKEFYALYGT